MATDEFRVVAIYINLTLAAVAVGNTVELQRSSLSTASRIKLRILGIERLWSLVLCKKKGGLDARLESRKTSRMLKRRKAPEGKEHKIAFMKFNIEIIDIFGINMS